MHGILSLNYHFAWYYIRSLHELTKVPGRLPVPIVTQSLILSNRHWAWFLQKQWDMIKGMLNKVFCKGKNPQGYVVSNYSLEWVFYSDVSWKICELSAIRYYWGLNSIKYKHLYNWTEIQKNYGTCIIYESVLQWGWGEFHQAPKIMASWGGFTKYYLAVWAWFVSSVKISIHWNSFILKPMTLW